MQSILAIFVGLTAVVLPSALGEAILGRIMFGAWNSKELIEAMRRNPRLAFNVAGLILRLLFSTAGGYIAAALASSASIWHAVALAALLFIMSLLSVRRSGSTEYIWTVGALVILSPFFVTLGGWLQTR